MHAFFCFSYVVMDEFHYHIMVFGLNKHQVELSKMNSVFCLSVCLSLGVFSCINFRFRSITTSQAQLSLSLWGWKHLNYYLSFPLQNPLNFGWKWHVLLFQCRYHMPIIYQTLPWKSDHQCAFRSHCFCCLCIRRLSPPRSFSHDSRCHFRSSG